MKMGFVLHSHLPSPGAAVEQQGTPKGRDRNNQQKQQQQINAPDMKSCAGCILNKNRSHSCPACAVCTGRGAHCQFKLPLFPGFPELIEYK